MGAARQEQADGEVEKFKARVVAKGYSQREGIDYIETLFPTVRLESLRALFALAASQGMEMDVITAFIYAEIDGEVYMGMMEGMRQWNGVIKFFKGDKVRMILVETYVKFRMTNEKSLVSVVVGLRFVQEMIIIDCAVGWCPRRSSP